MCRDYIWLYICQVHISVRMHIGNLIHRVQRNKHQIRHIDNKCCIVAMVMSNLLMGCREIRLGNCIERHD